MSERVKFYSWRDLLTILQDMSEEQLDRQFVYYKRFLDKDTENFDFYVVKEGYRYPHMSIV